MFEDVEGENREDYPLEQLFCRLAQIYRLDSGGIGIVAETFRAESMVDFYRLRDNPSLPPALAHAIDQKDVMIAMYAERLKQFSKIDRNDLSDFHITHGDAGGNCIVNGNQLFIIDWDTVKLAPVERDAWFYICNGGRIAAVNAVMQKHKLGYTL